MSEDPKIPFVVKLFFPFSAHFSCPKSLEHLPKVLLAAPGFIGTFGIGALGMVSSEGWKIRSFQPFFIHPKAQQHESVRNLIFQKPQKSLRSKNSIMESVHCI